MNPLIESLIKEFEENWRSDAACRGLDHKIFFQVRGKSNRQAKQICLDCPVVVECGDFAMGITAKSPQKFGVWGGQTYKQRVREKPKRVRAIELQNELDTR